jgi:hypothetical protein
MAQFSRTVLRCRGCGRRFHKRISTEDLVENPESVAEDSKAKESAKLSGS